MHNLFKLSKGIWSKFGLSILSSAAMLAASSPAFALSANPNSGLCSSAFFLPFKNAMAFLSGNSPLVAFAVMAGGFGLLVTLLLGEDRGMLTGIIKWIGGAAGLMGLSSLVSTFFNLSLC